MTLSKFEDLEIYQLAEKLSELVWEKVIKWDYFPRSTVGAQYVEAADSVGANISEGYGRGSFADRSRFAKISRGSLFETKTWLTKAKNRKLISEDLSKNFTKDIDLIGKKLYSYINSIGKQSPVDLMQTNKNDR